MPVTVKTFASFGEAASALSSDRSARYLGGGTLVMRALNEGDISISTVVRATDQALSRIDVASARVTIGAGVTFARILAERDLAFLHAPARSIGGPAVRNMGTVGGNLFAPSPYGDFTVALLALDATVSVQGGLGARDMPIEEFLQSRERQSGALVLAVSCQRPASADAFRYRKIARIKPKGGSVITLAAHLPAGAGQYAAGRNSAAELLDRLRSTTPGLRRVPLNERGFMTWIHGVAGAGQQGPHLTAKALLEAHEKAYPDRASCIWNLLHPGELEEEGR